MKTIYINALGLVALVLLSACSNIGNAGDQKAAFGSDPNVKIDVRGWDYLVGRLKLDGIDPGMISAVYASALMPRNEKVSFSLNPKESPHIYKRFTDANRIVSGRNFLKRYANSFSYAEKTFAVNRYVTAAILLIESDFGKLTGRELIVWRLSRLATISDPQNVEWNYKRLLKDTPEVKLEDLKTRAAYLDALFYPELEALFEFAAANNTDVFQLRGSVAGAFGIPQFLPSSYKKYAVDGNLDGVVSIYREEDAIASVANYLSKSGWSDKYGDEAARRQAIWSYNRSAAYVDAVLSVARLLKAIPKQRTQAPKTTPRRNHGN